jgi:tRNA threonylcarbamoyladenosine biosynthesis protein TsaE
VIEPGEYTTSSPEETEALGRRIGASVEGRTVLLLVGDLGAGKTLLTRGIAGGLGVDPDEVSSPTFSLVNVYEGGRLPMYHLDLYRLDERTAEASLYGLGFEEILDHQAAVVVEWADRLGSFPVPEAFLVEIEDTGDEARRIRITRLGARGYPSP